MAVVAAPAVVLVLGTYFVVSYRRNQRMAAREFGGLTSAEASLNRFHAAAILLVIVGSMGLAVGAAVSTSIRDALADVGEQSRWLPLALAPVALLYGRWLSRTVRRASRERVTRDRG